ncbi:hypothetical protein B5M09_012151 [Aphanomyces astaci]|uniref:Peptidase M13 N-terminal domain-containing protein n=1 Tax=Aphanomyces astaci TaxID=112090 RepID=A0A425DBJ0_APHAT|nr:hypothetical protein B5M09_012151 [Aphanomyces astaci]
MRELFMTAPTRPSKPFLSKATGVPLFVKLSVSPDDADVTRNILSADNPGLPFGQEYFHEPLWATVEKSYRQYLATIFTLAGHAEVETAIDVVIKFERMNAGVEPSKRRLQEAVTPRRLSLSDANASYPLGLGLPLQGFGFDVHKGCNTTTVLVNDPYYFDFLEKMLRRMHVDDLKTIIEYKVLDFNAVNTVCKSTREQVTSSIGDLLGTYYLKEVWTDEIAARADSLVLKLKATFKTGLDNVGWLDDTTRANATTKLSKFTHLLGGGQNPKTYPTLTFDPKAYIGNLNKVSAFDTAFNLAQIDTAVDKQIWETTALDANADGKFNPLWTATVMKLFDEKSKCFVEQYGSMDIKSELTGDLLGKVNGKLTLTETIADNGGLNAAYRGYQDYMHAEAEATKYTKETGEKMFWIRYGQSWCEKNSDEYLQFCSPTYTPLVASA